MTTPNRPRLTLDGYRPGAPNAEADAIDEAVAESMTCRKCGGSCYYEPFSRPGSYRPFAVCLDCGHVEEF